MKETGKESLIGNILDLLTEVDISWLCRATSTCSWADTDALVDEIEEFLTGARTSTEGNVVTATIVFSDIVASTEYRHASGDASGRGSPITTTRWCVLHLCATGVTSETD